MIEKKNVNLNINIKEIEKKFDELFPICRSILGEGFRQSLKILGENLNLKISKIKSGKKIFDWTIPNEWNIKDAYLLNNKKKKVLDFKKNNLHVVGYSMPINKTIKFKDLKNHLFTIKKKPNAIPYVTSYYRKFWGFCIEYNRYKKLNKKSNYKAIIKSSLKPGILVFSDNKIKGKLKKEILIYTYLCHPQMANNELSGPLVWRELFKILKNETKHNYTFRFVAAPENIGSLAFLYKNKKNIKNIKAGFIINCVGNGKEFTLKKSRQGNSISDRAALNVLKNSNLKYKVVNFFPDGSDERQFCSPGFNLPIALIMRKMFGEFSHYHTSLDNKKNISFQLIQQSIKVYYEVLKTIDYNFIPTAKILYGTPQLSKSKYDLYPRLMNFNIAKKSDANRLMLEILNKAEGKHDLIDICNHIDVKLIDHIEMIENLVKAGYIKKNYK